jgi:hypothetical protein
MADVGHRREESRDVGHQSEVSSEIGVEVWMNNISVRIYWVLPLLHLLLCATAFVSFDRVVDCLLFVDFPLSALLFAVAWVFKFSNLLVLTLFAVFGTIWWHAWGRLIDRRFLNRKRIDVVVDSSGAAGSEGKKH